VVGMSGHKVLSFLSSTSKSFSFEAHNVLSVFCDPLCNYHRSVSL